MTDKTLAQVPLSFLDYRVIYREPIFDVEKLESEAARAVFLAFREWNVTLENVSFKEDAANLNEVSTYFTLLGGRFVFSIGVGASGLFVTNPSWSEADLVARIANAGAAAVEKTTGAVVEKQVVNVWMHLKPASGSIRDFASHLVQLNASPVPNLKIRSYGVAIYSDDSTWVVDASTVYPDALFVRIQRTFGSGVALDKIIAQLNADETKILELLRLEVE